MEVVSVHVGKNTRRRAGRVTHRAIVASPEWTPSYGASVSVCAGVCELTVPLGIGEDRSIYLKMSPDEAVRLVATLGDLLDSGVLPPKGQS